MQRFSSLLVPLLGLCRHTLQRNFFLSEGSVSVCEYAWGCGVSKETLNYTAAQADTGHI